MAMNIAVLQRFIPAYRLAVFDEIAKLSPYEVKYIIGENVAGVKANNASEVDRVNHIMLKSKGINIFGRILVWHFGLFRTLFRLRPKIVVCEAESHFLGYLTAIFYKVLMFGRPKLILWCFYILPGEETKRSLPSRIVRRLIRKFFSSFISYGDLGKSFLIDQGVDAARIFVANNVCDTPSFIRRAVSLEFTQSEAKASLGFGDNFLVSYVGTLDFAKRPDLLIQVAEMLAGQKIHICLIGSGPMEEQLRRAVLDKNLKNITVVGRITSGLDLYYRASDLLVLPGRGGIVISEAMCFSTPVMAYQADGTEIDLLLNNQTGYLLPTGTAEVFSQHIKRLSADPEECKVIGARGHKLIVNAMNTRSMALSVIDSFHYCLS